MRLRFYSLLVICLLTGALFSRPAQADTTTNKCQTNSTVNVTLTNYDGTPAKNLKVEIYEEDYTNNDLTLPIVGQQVMSGTTDSNGNWTTNSFLANSNIRYIVHIYDQSSSNGDFWYFEQFASCGNEFDFKQVMPRLTLILRDSNHNLIKDASLSLYALHPDVDGNPTIDQKYLVSNLTISPLGLVTFYVSGNVPHFPDKTGTYFLLVKRNNQTFIFNNIHAGTSDKSYEYVLSGLSLSAKTASGKILGNENINLYSQEAGPSLGSRLYSTQTAANGQVAFDYPSGVYALVLSDDFNQNNIFYNVVVSDGGATVENLTVNSTKLYLASTAADPKNSDQSRSFQIYSLLKGDNGLYYKNKSIGSVILSPGIDKEISLAPGPYLFTYNLNNQEYGRTFMAANNQVRLGLSISDAGQINSNNGLSVKASAPISTSAAPSSKPVEASSNIPKEPFIQNKYRGDIVNVTGNGGLWYIGQDGKRYRLDKNYSAFEVLKSLSVGITNGNLNKIPVGLSTMYGLDSDHDGLPNALEIAIGTNPFKADSDGDHYSDYTELKSGYNPLGAGRLKYNLAFANGQKGRVFIQVQGLGQLWYISPRDGKRYFLFSGADSLPAAAHLAISADWKDIGLLPAGN
jgi:hypothetical protein